MLDSRWWTQRYPLFCSCCPCRMSRRATMGAACSIFLAYILCIAIGVSMRAVQSSAVQTRTCDVLSSSGCSDGQCRRRSQGYVMRCSDCSGGLAKEQQQCREFSSGEGGFQLSGDLPEPNSTVDCYQSDDNLTCSKTSSIPTIILLLFAFVPIASTQIQLPVGFFFWMLFVLNMIQFKRWYGQPALPQQAVVGTGQVWVVGAANVEPPPP